ncbi:hypothetical protein PMAYCL1PPCAC_14394, partial [Pristionchus mayeri]
VWPADTSLYDWSQQHSHWDGQPIPIDDVDHVFDPLDYSIPPTPHYPIPQQQQQQYPTPEQAQVSWSREEQTTMDRLIDEQIDALDEFEGFDLDELDNLLGVETAEATQRPPAEEDSLAEFFPMLGSSSTAALMPAQAAIAPSTFSISPPPSSLTPPMYHDMTSGAYDLAPSTSMYQSTTTTHTIGYHGAMECGAVGGPGGEWVRMGAPDGRIDRSPTFMDTGCDLNVYLNDWYDEPSTSRSSPDSLDDMQQYQQLQPPPLTSSLMATTSRRQTVRYAPYASPAASARRTPAPANKRAPVFRPEGFGTPALGENADEYRKRRDKNNVSSARSRAKKADLLKEMKAEAIQLERKNIELKAVLESLDKEVSYYKELMMTALSK